MKNLALLSVLIVATGCGNMSKPTAVYEPMETNSLRAPAYPLVTIDPYTSAWSFSDKLNEDETKHWTGKPFPLLGGIRVDGKSYRFMGREEIPLLPVLETAASMKWEGVYTETKPTGNWMAADYQPAGWKKGVGAFGTDGNPNRETPWNTRDIWVRRSFDLGEDVSKETLYLKFSHDDNIEIYINGMEVATTGRGLNYDLIKEIPAEVIASLKPTGNVIAAHCLNDVGGGYVDFGIMKKVKRGDTFEAVAEQLSAQVLPTQTFYTFRCGPVDLDVIFTAPALMDDLNILSSPFNYLTYQVRSTDGASHDVQIYVEATPQWAVDKVEQPVTFERGSKKGIGYLKTGTAEQAVLGKKGDDLRIDWGYFYLAAAESDRTALKMNAYYDSKKEFMETGTLSADGGRTSGDMQKEMTVLAFTDNLGKVGDKKTGGHLMIGYDDLYSIQYFNDNRMAYWKQEGKVDIMKAFEDGERMYPELMKRCGEFDKQMMTDAAAAGGKSYAELCALAYRQAIAAHKLVTDKEGNLLFLSKENFSNGSIGTVDVTYPSAPLFLVYNPDLLKGMLNPIFYYSESGKWTKPFAAHDVGTYPLANGQTYGGDMPVEESGNMLILTTAIACVEGNADYAAKHWDVLTTWADYLQKEGLDPENQLCTDDFAGHFAHNTNLSIKAIMGVAGYGKLAGMLGKKDVEAKYMQTARDMAAKWVEMAKDGDHYKLTFDKSGTWSQKYNLVWDRLLGFNIFPTEVAATELAFYKTKQNAYGLPLDNREDYTKSDWIIWTACLTGSQADFDALVNPVWKYANETSTRVPLSDWHMTSNGSQRGFQARSVVGGYFMRMLEKKLMK
ncbi:glutaminase domain-containing protein [Macellibacteroides fermentans]|uniref:glutaminase domain-containing protein n=1 Tax=Macellibacteroides fermentans TaxID=879969 RepID=UPI00406D23D1